MNFSLDVETSGLHPEEDYLTCLGFGSHDGFRQFAARGPDEESYAIQSFDNAWAECYTDTPPVFITYNGRGFDIPFITSRAALHGIHLRKSFMEMKQIDMSLYAKKANHAFIAKDLFLNKFLNLYVPRSCSGAWLARQYSLVKQTPGALVDPDVHLQNLTHNAIDLGVTLRAHQLLLPFPDYQAFINEELQRED